MGHGLPQIVRCLCCVCCTDGPGAVVQSENGSEPFSLHFSEKKEGTLHNIHSLPLLDPSRLVEHNVNW